VARKYCPGGRAKTEFLAKEVRSFLRRQEKGATGFMSRGFSGDRRRKGQILTLRYAAFARKEGKGEDIGVVSGKNVKKRVTIRLV